MRASELWNAPRRCRWWVRARRVDVLHGATEQAVELPVRRDPVEQPALTVAVAVGDRGDPAWVLLVDNVGSRHRGACLPSVRSTSPSLFSLFQVRLLRLSHLAHQHRHPLLCLAFDCSQQRGGGGSSNHQVSPSGLRRGAGRRLDAAR